MPRLKLTLAYEGTRYAGWQLQAHEGAGHAPSIQGELERAVARLTGGGRRPIFGAGRTDAGVHAEAQVCHLDLPERALRIDWLRALNVALPTDIRILDATWTHPDFHARKKALAKRYAYSLWMHRERANPRIANFCWSVPELDADRLAGALPLLTGRRDFASFRNSGTEIKNTQRNLFSLRLVPGAVGPLGCPPSWPVLTLLFEGDGFLKQMVRNLAGLLVWVGLGKISPKQIDGIFAALDRRALPSPSAPARGLTLMEVLY